MRRRQTALDGEIARLVDAVASVGISDAIAQRLKAAEAERSALTGRLTSTDTPADVVIDDAIRRYRRLLTRLKEVLGGGAEADLAYARRILGDMLGPVDIGRDPQTGELYAEMEEPAARLLFTANEPVPGRVAGARFELATFGL